MSKDDLQSLRDEIDRIDQQIQRLINERAGCAKRVADVKLENVDLQNSEAPLFYRPEREAQVLRKVMERNEGPMDAKEVAHIFREIMSACLALEQPMEIAYLGPEGTFTQAAALKHFGHSVMTRSFANIAEVFEAVALKTCHYGVVPVENSTEGMVTHTLDNFISSPLKICGELELPISLNLLVKSGVSDNQITKICAHQQALAQSRHWLQQHYHNIEVQSVSSNGEAAKMASEDATIAAVAGDLAAERYDLSCLAANIQDYSDNTTRFLVISHDEVAASGEDKTSIIVSTRNVPGALFKLLAPLEAEGISLTRIETRPSRTENWAYVFFMEFHGHHQDPAVKRVTDAIAEQSFFVKVLGSYPAAVI
ncbi:prephenate dehydratase [Pseudomonadales bacterium]|nr:prephenate dehydratase [Pseudomonadales bacterium]